MTLSDLLDVSDLWNELGTSLRIQTKDNVTLFDSYYFTCRFGTCWEMELDNVEVLRLAIDSQHEDASDCYEVTLNIESKDLYLDIEENRYYRTEDLMREYCRKSMDGELYDDCSFARWIEQCTSKNGTLIHVYGMSTTVVFKE